MRKLWIRICLLAVVCALAGSATNQVNAQEGGWDVSGYDSIQTPLPIGSTRPGMGEVFGSAEFLYIFANRNIGNQAIAKRGFVDSDGSITGTVGQFVGSGNYALDTTSFGRTSWAPGMRLGLGYRFEDGLSISLNYTHLFDAKYNTSASPIPPDFNTGQQLADSFLFSPVYNFSTYFAGPQNRVPVGSGSSPYGIWNGATDMYISYIQRYDNWDLTARLPVFETEYAKTQAVFGGRFAWIWERFGWTTNAFDSTGNLNPADVGNYTNIMSQRMYGPFVGCSHDVFLGNQFSLNAEVTGALLYDIVKTKAEYARGDMQMGSKRAADLFGLVPNVNASINLAWYPIQGVSIRVGYNIWSFFNTYYMQQPVSFNYGAIDPSYKQKFVELFNGLNFGLAISF